MQVALSRTRAVEQILQLLSITIMRIRALVCLATVVTVTVLSISVHAQRIKVGPSIVVPLFVTVTDQEKRLVSDLVQEDFEVYDNGKLQTITNFDNEPTPITAIVMIDTSGSMTVALDFVKDGAEQFLLRLLPQDKAKVGAFNDKIQFIPQPGFPFSDNRDQLVRALKELDFGYPTRLFDAIDQSIEQLNPVEGRKVILVFTDGDDNASRIGSGEVVDRARQDDVMVYSIGLENEYFDGAKQTRSSPDRRLKRLSEETGGGFFLLKRKDELGSTFTRVAQELHSQYLLGFSPTVLDGKVHKLDVKVKRAGISPRARKSYVATAVETTQK
jgi:Ca-activated chloride channel homolog